MMHPPGPLDPILGRAGPLDARERGPQEDCKIESRRAAAAKSSRAAASSPAITRSWLLRCTIDGQSTRRMVHLQATRYQMAATGIAGVAHAAGSRT